MRQPEASNTRIGGRTEVRALTLRVTIVALQGPDRRKLTPVATNEQTRRRMLATRRRNTSGEVALQTHLRRMRIRFSVDVPPIPGQRRRADLVLFRHRIAVFMDGCFWHSCPTHGTQPKSHRAWWRQKLDTNKKRDLDTNRSLRRAGWRVIRAWSHDDPASVASRVAAARRRAVTVSPRLIDQT